MGKEYSECDATTAKGNDEYKELEQENDRIVLNIYDESCVNKQVDVNDDEAVDF